MVNLEPALGRRSSVRLTHEQKYPEGIATREEVLDFCNRLRKAGGGDLLDELLPGAIGNSRYCLLARALNFDCTVKPQEALLPSTEKGRPYSWVMWFTSSSLAYEVAGKLELEPYGARAIRLPQRIANVAAAFDQHELPWDDAEPLYGDYDEIAHGTP